MSGHAEAARTKATNPVHQFDWNDEKIEELKRLVAERHSYGTIAKMMGGGLTRNAVLGKALRMKLRGTEDRNPRLAPTALATPSQRARRAKNNGGLSRKIARASREKPKAMSTVEALAAISPRDAEGQRHLSGPTWQALDGAAPIPLVQLTEHTCKWPIGDHPILFCGLSSAAGSPYCDRHRSVARGY